MDKTKIFCNELYKDDSYFMELLGSEDKARQCDYRNAIIKELKRRKKANKDSGEMKISRRTFLLKVLRDTLILGCLVILAQLVLFGGATGGAIKITIPFICVYVVNILLSSIIGNMLETKDSNDVILVDSQYDELMELVGKDSRSILMAKKEALDEVIWNLGKP